MTWTTTRRYISRWALFALVLAVAVPAYAQTLTSGITGRATDESGGALPGVDVTVSSPNLLGGTRNTVTDETGTYRFTLLPSGTYTVSFMLPGFTTLNIEGVTVNVGATMTINGRMTVATLEETVTVTSQAPTIDLQSANVNVNWDQQKMDDIPYARSLTGLVALVPGLYATSYDVGGSNFGTGSGPAARNFGRAGGNVVSYDGMIWDQTYGDFGSYEEAQVMTAAKGADALNPGVTMNLVVKSGSNTFRGVGAAQFQDGDFQSNNITDELLAKGYAPGANKFTQFKDFYGELGGPIIRDKFWFYAGYRDASNGLFIPGFISLATGEQAEFYTKLTDPTAKLSYQVSTNNKLEAMVQGGRKWQPYRTASRFVPLEATQNQDSWSLIGPSLKWLSVLSPRATFDAAFQRGGYWWPDVPWTSDVRRTDLTTTTTHGAFLEVKRVPRRYQYSGTFTYFAELGGRNHEIKSGYLGWYNMATDTEQIGYPNQQLYRYRSLAGDADPFLRPDSVQVFDYPNTVKAGEKYHSFYINDKISLTPQLTLNVGLRWDRYSSFLPEQGNPGTGPFATEAIFPYNDDYPVYSTIVPRVSAVYDVTGEGRFAVRASYGRYTGGGSGASTSPAPGASNVNPNATITRTYSNWDGSIPYVPVAANLASVTGGGTNRTIQSDLKSPYMDEWTVGADFGLSRTVTMQVNVVRKHDGRGNKTWNDALPFAAWTDVRNNVDPGPDNIVGTADDGVIPIYSVPRSFPTFGQNIEVIRQHDEDEGQNRYTSFGVTMNKQLSSGWSLLLAYNADYRDLDTDNPRNPNEALYGAGTVAGQNYMFNEPEWNHAFKMSGTYELPWGIQYGTALTVQSGNYYYREVQVRNALNAAVTVRFPKAGQYPTVTIWDNRVSKRFNLPAGQSVEGIVDLFNSTNSNVILAQVLRNGPTFGQPTEIMAARVFRLGIRYRF